MIPSALFVLNPTAKFKSVRDVLCVSGVELQNLTGLSPADVQQLLTTAATACRQHPPAPGLSHLQSHITQVQHWYKSVCVYFAKLSCSGKHRVPDWSLISGSVWAVLCWMSC